MSQHPWYKRYPADFIAGTLELSLEEKGAFSIIIDLLHDKGGAMDDDPQWLARVMGCSVRKWKAIREQLLAKGKIYIDEGKIVNQRVKREVYKPENAAKTPRKSSENSVKTSRKVDEKVRDLFEIKDLEKKSEGYTRNQILETRNQKERTPIPPEGDFDVWYKIYPHKVGRKDAARAYAKAVKNTSPEILLAGVQRYIKTKRPDAPWCNPSTWLNQGRWEDQPADIQKANGYHKLQQPLRPANPQANYKDLYSS